MTSLKDPITFGIRYSEELRADVVFLRREELESLIKIENACVPIYYNQQDSISRFPEAVSYTINGRILDQSVDDDDLTYIRFMPLSMLDDVVAYQFVHKERPDYIVLTFRWIDCAELNDSRSLRGIRLPELEGVQLVAKSEQLLIDSK